MCVLGLIIVSLSVLGLNDLCVLSVAETFRWCCYCLVGLMVSILQVGVMTFSASKGHDHLMQHLPFFFYLQNLFRSPLPFFHIIL